MANPATWLTLGKVVGTAVVGAGAAKAMAPKPPKLEKPKAAPIPDDEETRINAEREKQRKYAASGRSGTVMSTGGTLG